MKKFICKAAMICFTVGLAPLFAADPWAGTFTVDASGHLLELTVEKLKSDFVGDIKPISFTLHGTAHTADGVPLLTVLRAAGVQTELKPDPTADPKVKNAPLRETILVVGRDGYTAAFSLGELLPDIGNKEAWIVIDRDTAVLAERSGPVELIVPTDNKPGRWVRAVATIIVDPHGSPTTRP